MQKYQYIKFENRDSIGIITLDRPKKANAVTWETLEEISNCITNQVNPYSSGITAVVLSANGKHFTAGIDMQSAMMISSAAEDVEA